MKNARVSNKAAAMGCMFGLVLTVVIIGGISAWAQAGPKTLVKHVLKGTYYAVAPGVTVSCGTENCVQQPISTPKASPVQALRV
jgi:hypothetical protein